MRYSSRKKIRGVGSHHRSSQIEIKRKATKILDCSTPLISMKGIKETLLAPRFYTTDFDEMEQLFNTEMNKNLNEAEFEALLQEFKTDYNQTHFVRNKEFKKATQGTHFDFSTQSLAFQLQIRSNSSSISSTLAENEPSGRRDLFLNVQGRSSPRSDFNLALDLGFLTKARKYTFFKPKFIFYATYLSEKIGYWRYITLYRHLKANPEYQVYPIFKYFENRCQDENNMATSSLHCVTIVVLIVD
ncbi:hypothetical protein LXL04_002922 [Taraxacum kok-saghyz]